MDLQEARALHDEVPVIDLHADTPKLMERRFDIAKRHRHAPERLNYIGHVDLPRMREGGMAAQIFGMWTFPYPRRGCVASIHSQLDAIDAAARKYPEQITWALTPDHIRAAQADGKVAALAGIEGGHALEKDLDHIATFAARGVRYLGFGHFSVNALCTPAMGRGANHSDGLTDLGKDAIRECNRVGMVIDLAHINRPGFFDALELTRHPVMVSHTGVTGVHEHNRNINDEQLRAVADNGGCVGVIFCRRFLGGDGLGALCDHIIHIMNIAGEDTPSLGSDFDGFVIPPRGLEDVADLPKLTVELGQRGVSRRALKKILGENALRVLGDVAPTFEEAQLA